MDLLLHKELIELKLQ